MPHRPAVSAEADRLTDVLLCQVVFCPNFRSDGRIETDTGNPFGHGQEPLRQPRCEGNPSAKRSTHPNDRSLSNGRVLQVPLRFRLGAVLIGKAEAMRRMPLIVLFVPLCLAVAGCSKSPAAGTATAEGSGQSGNPPPLPFLQVSGSSGAGGASGSSGSVSSGSGGQHAGPPPGPGGPGVAASGGAPTCTAEEQVNGGKLVVTIQAQGPALVYVSTAGSGQPQASAVMRADQSSVTIKVSSTARPAKVTIYANRQTGTCTATDAA